MNSSIHERLVNSFKNNDLEMVMEYSKSMTEEEIIKSCLLCKRKEIISLLSERISIFNIIRLMDKLKRVDKAFFKKILLEKKNMITASVSNQCYKNDYYLPIYRSTFNHKRISFVANLLKHQ